MDKLQKRPFPSQSSQTDDSDELFKLIKEHLEELDVEDNDEEI